MRHPELISRIGIGMALAIVVLAGCSSSGSDKPPPTTTSAAPTTSASPATTTTTPAPTRPKAAFAVQEILGMFVATGPPCTLTPTSRPAQAILFDRDRKSCYLVGPALLTGTAIDKATVVYDSMISRWAVDLHWSNDDFLTKIAKPLVGRQIAIVVNGVVQSAPTINPGITGRDVQISGDFTKAEAVQLAASIIGVAPSAVTIEPRVD